MATPSIPSAYAWASGARPTSVHTTGVGGFFRYNTNQLMLAGITLGIGVLLLGVHFGRGPQTNTLLPGIIFSALAIPLVVWAVVRFQGLVHEVRLFPEGIVWLDRGKWRGWRWEEIDQVFRTEVRVNGGISRKHVLLASGGKKVTLQYALGRWDRMADVIQAETANVLLPLARESLRAGESVDFRKVEISATGLRIEKKDFDFDQIKDIELGNGMIIVYPHGKRGEPQYVTLGEVPNYLVFLKLLEESPAPEVRLRR